MDKYNQDAVWYGTYFMVAFFILRFYVVHFNLGHGDELAHSGWAALGALIFGAPIYYFFRDKMQLTKSIPLAIMVLVGIGCYFLL